MFVAKHYLMDPTTETLARYTDLADGMVVLCADDSTRLMGGGEKEDELDSWITKTLRRYSRWCTVRNADTMLQTFIGTYDDGTEEGFDLSAPCHLFWFVKKDSMRSPEPLQLIRINPVGPQEAEEYYPSYEDPEPVQDLTERAKQFRNPPKYEMNPHGPNSPEGLVHKTKTHFSH